MAGRVNAWQLWMNLGVIGGTPPLNSINMRICKQIVKSRQPRCLSLCSGLFWEGVTSAPSETSRITAFLQASNLTSTVSQAARQGEKICSDYKMEISLIRKPRALLFRCCFTFYIWMLKEHSLLETICTYTVVTSPIIIVIDSSSGLVHCCVPLAGFEMSHNTSIFFSH